MNKYKVKVNHLFYEIIDIEAENEEKAKELAVEEIRKQTHRVVPYYGSMLPVEHWQVITDEEYKKLEEEFKNKMEELEKINNPGDYNYNLNQE